MHRSVDLILLVVSFAPLVPSSSSSSGKIHQLPLTSAMRAQTETYPPLLRGRVRIDPTQIGAYSICVRPSLTRVAVNKEEPGYRTLRLRVSNMTASHDADHDDTDRFER